MYLRPFFQLVIPFHKVKYTDMCQKVKCVTIKDHVISLQCASVRCVCVFMYVFLPTVWEKYKGENTLSQKPYRGEMYLYWTEFQGIMGCLILRAQAIFVMVVNDEAPFNFLVELASYYPNRCRIKWPFLFIDNLSKKARKINSEHELHHFFEYQPFLCF